MFLRQAEAILQDLISPEPYDRFLDEVVERRPLAITGNPPPARLDILGPDPGRTLLDSFEAESAKLTCHAGKPSGPPPAARQVYDAAAFEAMIREFHERRYTVRFPDVTGLSPALQRIVRAFEVIVRQPVATPAFWSQAGATAPVHQDEQEIFVIQLSGRKRWSISNAPPSLTNVWKRVGETAPPLTDYRVVDMEPGDLLYMPRGTPHTVQSTTESIHISIGFVPMTVRDGLIAVLDHLSDFEQPLRAGIADRLDAFRNGEVPASLPQRVRAGLQRLIAAAQSDAFILEAIEHRLSRNVRELPRLPSSEPASQLTVETRVRRSPLALAHIIALPHTVDFSQPGGAILVHPGAEECMRFIASAEEFRIGDVPGAVGDDIRIALVQRLLQSGFLEVAYGSDAGAPSPGAMARIESA